MADCAGWMLGESDAAAISSTRACVTVTASQRSGSRDAQKCQSGPEGEAVERRLCPLAAARSLSELQDVAHTVPVVHAIHVLGLLSETFIRDAIAEVEALGRRQWIVTEAIVGVHTESLVGRTVVAPQSLPLIDRVAVSASRSSKRDQARARAARKYLTAISRIPPGILHAHFGWTAVDCTLAARDLGLPFLASFHGTDLTVDAEDPAWRAHYEALLHRVDGVTVVSRFLERRVRTLGFTGDVHLIPSGVRLGQFPFSGGPRHGTTPRLLMVGRLIACKGFDVGIEALAIARGRGVLATMRVVGDGPMRHELERTARKLGVDGAVEFLGARKHSDVRDELERTDIVLVPSRRMPSGQEEGSSVVSKEAQAIGVPVVATEIGGIPETLPPDLRFELVPPDQPELLAARFIDIWHQREGWPARLQMQREWIASEFAWEDIARRLSNLYDHLIERRPPRRAMVARGFRLSRRGTSARS